MSWSMSAIGKPEAVFESIRKQFNQAQCDEPEEGVRVAAFVAIEAALAAQRPDCVVKVVASGGMAQTYDQITQKWGPPITNNLAVSIEVLYGFVE